MTDTPNDIPNRAAFRAAEVCEIAKIPPYVLRSWEKEFPGLGAASRPGGPRIYRRSDIEQILRIKQLVFVEGLTLAGVRRRIEGEPPDEDAIPIESEPTVVPAVPEDVRNRVSQARRELRDLLDLLMGGAQAAEAKPALAPPEPAGEAEALPLLNGVLDTPPKPRRGRRTTRPAPPRPPGEVE